MRIRIATAITLLALASAGTASAQYQYQAAAMPNWSGPYLGASIGLGTAKPILSGADFGDLLSTRRSVLGGIQGGYNFQSGSIVAGLEADYMFGSLDGTASCIGGAACSSSLRNLGSLRGRLGWAIAPPALIYFTAGLGWGNSTLNSPIGSLSQTTLGTAFGGGLEVMLSKNWTLNAEYLRYDLGKISADPGALSLNAVDLKPRADTFKLGVNFKF